MPVVLEKNLWVAQFPFEQRHIPKQAGFWWHGGECRPGCVACKSGLRIKVWWTPKPEVAAKLKSQCDDAALAALSGYVTAVEASKAEDADVEIPVPDGLSYLPYQRAGIAYAMKRKNTLIADEMGLGKSVQSIGIINVSPDAKSVLIVCPASLRLNWKREATKWLVRKFSIMVIEAMKDTIPEDASLVIVNYELLRGKYIADPTGAMNPEGKVLKVWQPSQILGQVMARSWDVLIVDECHKLKNPKSLQAISLLGYAGNKKKQELPIPGVITRANRNVFLTGTPILNRPIEIQPVAAALAPAEFGNFFTFAKRYAGAVKERFGWDFSGATNLGELQEKLRGTCLTEDALVSSEHGVVTIKELVSKRVQVRVWSSDPMGRLSLKPIVGFSARPHRGILVKVRFAEGELVCTDDHRIYTDQGEVRADQIAPGDYLCTLPEEINENSGHGKDNGSKSNVLLNAMCRTGETATPKGRFQGGDCDEAEVFGKDLRALRVLVHGEERAPVSREEILHVQMQRKASLPSNACDAAFHECDCEAIGKKKELGTVSPTKGKRGAACGSHAREDKKNSAVPERESQTATECRAQNAGRCPIGGGGFPGRANSDTRNEHDLCRYIDSGKTSDNRGGRRGPCEAFKSNERQGTGRGAPGTRVLSVEILGMGNRGITPSGPGEDIVVYDIEVEDNHNFFANGILVHNCMVRRLKSDVLKDLPQKRRQIIVLPVDGASKAVAAESNAWKMHEERLHELRNEADFAHASGDGDAYKAAVGSMRAAMKLGFEEIAKERINVAIAKLPKVIEHLEDAIDQGINKIIVFGHHHVVCNGIADHFGTAAVKLTGEVTSNEARQDAVDRFQKDPSVKIFVGSIGAAGVGHTLTAASTVIFAELDWVPAMVTQAEDRAHRIGQKNQVLIQHLVLDGSLDSRMAAMLIEKQEIADQALDNAAAPEIDVPELAEAPQVAPMPAAVPRPNRYPVVSEEKRAAALLAMKFLAGMCDGALRNDQAGFNKNDSLVGHKLSMTETLTDGQAWMASNMARKYRRQLPDSILEAIGISN